MINRQRNVDKWEQFEIERREYYYKKRHFKFEKYSNLYVIYIDN